MAGKANKIRNPDFSAGRAAPAGWTWRADSRRCRWSRGRDSAGVLMECAGGAGTCQWTQVLSCKPGEFYRVEAVVACDLAAGEPDAGLVLTVQPVFASRGRRAWRVTGAAAATPAVTRSSRPTVLRAYYEAPEGARQIAVSVGINQAAGSAQVSTVRVFQILEPDEIGHPLAVPPPAHALPAPRRARDVAVVTREPDRPVVSLLASVLGPHNVETVDPAEFAAGDVAADAVILADGDLPRGVRSLRSLFALAAERTVIVSLAAFAKLAGDSLSLRHVEQPDDPMHAEVSFANEYTVGFALSDAFPCSFAGRQPGSFAQNHFRKSDSQKAFFKKHGMEPMLLSLGAHDATSNRPMCLFKRLERGALFVFDVQPAEAEPSTHGDSVLPLYFLLNLLGRSRAHLGQFVSPFRREAGFRESIREMSRRFSSFVVHDDDVPVEEVREQLVTIGREGSAFGLPMTRRPVVLVRSGLRAGDAESIYGAWTWFKQLVRMPPHNCPYADSLASVVRLAWVPCVAGWEWGDGFRRTGKPPAHAVEVDCEPGEVAALIDITCVPRNGVRVVLPSDEGGYRRYRDWLPTLARNFPAGSYLSWCPAEGQGFADRDAFAWRMTQFSPEVAIDETMGQDEAYRRVMQAGGQVVRIEIAGCDFDFSTDSIRRTDVAATLLEHVIGLQFGLIAVNRQAAPVQFNGMRPVEPGEAIVLHRDDPALRALSHLAG